MICNACRSFHKGAPSACPDCGCQHKGELVKPTPTREPVRWFCKSCSITVGNPVDSCDCIEGEEGARVPVYENELDENEAIEMKHHGKAM